MPSSLPADPREHRTVPAQVDVVLPCLNEAAALPWVLERFPAWARPIVVDNASNDASARIAAELGALVVREERRGFGAAAHAGLLAASAPIVAFCDADASMDPRELHLVVEPIQAGRADLVLGRRVPRPGSWPAHARIANRALGALLGRRAGLRLRDLGPMRAARRTDLLDLNLMDRRFGYPLEMVVVAARARWRIVEVDTSYHPRIGRSKVTGTLRGTLRTVKDMSAVLAR
ncbi:MAG: glycosyltransferase family 2 protein [Sporichthyaceae bacterium]